MPQVTVFMPVHNGQAYLETAIKSILDQSFQDFELLIIDDGSTDKSLDIIQKVISPKIRVLQNHQNKGLGFTRNRGIQEAQGKYLAILDCDDWAFPQRLARQVDFLDKNPKVAAVGTWVKTIDENNREQGVWRLPTEHDEINSKLLFQNCFAQSAMMLRREILLEMPYRDEFAPAEDYDLWVRLSQNYELANLPEILLAYRIHTQGISQQKAEKLHQSVVAIVHRQLQALQIYATNKDLETHLKIAHLDKNLNFYDVSYWLSRLYAQNNKLEIYPKQAFKDLLVNYWKNYLLHQKLSLAQLRQTYSFELSQEIPQLWKILLKKLLNLS